MGVWASTEVDRIDLKRDVEEVSLGMTRYSSHYLPAEVKTEHDELNRRLEKYNVALPDAVQGWHLL